MAIQCAVGDRHLYCAGTNFRSADLPYSISVWLNATWSSGSTFSFVGMYDGVPNTGTPTVGLQIGARGVNTLSCWTYGGSVIINSNTMSGFDNTWVLITYTFDGVNSNLYRNSTLLATSAVAPVNSNSFTQIYVNGYPPTGTASETSTHQVDWYGYYSRVLTQPEIQAIYIAQGARHGITYGLLSSYEFDELSQGSTVVSCVDMTGNGNTLVNTGAGPALTYNYANTVANTNLRPVQ